jgi:DNA-binding HxlR family transcriptional regulator
LRDIYVGIRRFEQIRTDLGISRRILTARLETLVDAGVVEREPYQENPPRFDYVLTEKGRELVVAILALMAWGDKWAAPDGPPALIHHRSCGHIARPEVVCSYCAQPLDAEDLQIREGPGARRGPGTRHIARALQ